MFMFIFPLYLNGFIFLLSFREYFESHLCVICSTHKKGYILQWKKTKHTGKTYGEGISVTQTIRSCHMCRERMRWNENNVIHMLSDVSMCECVDIFAMSSYKNLSLCSKLFVHLCKAKINIHFHRNFKTMHLYRFERRFIMENDSSPSGAREHAYIELAMFAMQRVNH